MPFLSSRLHQRLRALSSACRSWGRGVALLLAVLLVLPACDSSESGPPPSDLEGTYTFTRFEFEVQGVDDFDLLADTLVTSDRTPRLDFFGGNATTTLVYRIEGNTGSSFLPGRFRTSSDQVTVDLSRADPAERFQLLLPQTVRFRLLNGKAELSADQEVTDVDLREYAPSRYSGLTQNVNGTLRLRLERQ